jgi:sulfur carrier protein
VHVTINGGPREVPEGTIAELLVHLGLTEGPVAVEVNRAIIPRAEHATHSLREGDVLELVHMVGGG